MGRRRTSRRQFIHYSIVAKSHSTHAIFISIIDVDDMAYFFPTFSAQQSVIVILHTVFRASTTSKQSSLASTSTCSWRCSA